MPLLRATVVLALLGSVMLKWAVFAALWIVGLFIGDVLAVNGLGGAGSRLVLFGGMWMLACIGVKDFIAGYQEAKARSETPNAKLTGSQRDDQ